MQVWPCPAYWQKSGTEPVYLGSIRQRREGRGKYMDYGHNIV